MLNSNWYPAPIKMKAAKKIDDFRIEDEKRFGDSGLDDNDATHRIGGCQDDTLQRHGLAGQERNRWPKSLGDWI